MRQRGYREGSTSRVGRFPAGEQEEAEQAFIDGAISREEAVAALGRERVEEIEYAKKALADDVVRGLTPCPPLPASVPSTPTPSSGAPHMRHLGAILGSKWAIR